MVIAPYIAITIAAVVVALVLALVWTVIVKAPPSIAAAPVFTEAGYGMRCTDTPTPSGNIPSQFVPQPCGPRLVCIKTSPTAEWGFCKRAIGAPCSTVVECEPAAQVCINVCGRGTSGGLNQPCSRSVPCDEKQGLECSANSVCKYRNGAAGCIDSTDCLQGSCQAMTSLSPDQSVITGGLTAPFGPAKVCVPRYPNGHACTQAYDCISNYCDISTSVDVVTEPNGTAFGSSGFCQNPGQRSGTSGAACLYFQNGQPACPAETVCFAPIEAEHTYGVCVAAPSIWSGAPCSINSGCLPPTVCFHGQCVMPRTNTQLLTNSCAAGNSTGLCTRGYTCMSDVCTPTADFVPDASGTVWSLLQWNRTSPVGLDGTPSSPTAGNWSAVIRNVPAPVGFNTLSVYTLPTGKSLAVYQAADGFYLLNPTPSRLNITGTMPFVVNAVRFTPGGQVGVLYSWTTGGTTRSQVSIQPIPESWVTGRSPEQSDISITNFTGYPTGPLSWFDVDDRTPESGIRFLVIGNSRLYVTLTSINAINTATGLNFLTPLTTGVSWAQFYSYAKGTQDVTAFLFAGNSNPRFIWINVPTGQLPPSISLPPLDIPAVVVMKEALFSSPGGGLSRSKLLYLVDYGPNGGLNLRLYDSTDLVLPGSFNSRLQLAVSQNSAPDFVPGYFILTTTQ